MDRVGGPFVTDLFVVSAVSQQQLLVVAEERRPVTHALVPQKDEPSARPKNSLEFRSRTVTIEPVCGLGRSNEIHAFIAQLGCLSRSRDAGELRKPCQQSLPRLAHLGVRLNSKHCIA